MSTTQGDWGALYARAQPNNLPPPLIQEWSWQLQGNCQEHPTELFYPVGRGHRLRLREEGAKRICRDCPVIIACREYALRAPEAYGIWGALTPRERARQLAAQQQPSPSEPG
ncbi:MULTISPECIES: WhiB family transcriptional regulator [unclassified Mycobacterium]|uniref:WhiB family transcriptional regulator n=1 Tax=unclassified Mycobacterium TaxID=2642494 RepID=UPI0029C7AC4E|nr:MULTISPECIES: WhiB family transcriptional regulator [unclassified Mycobacterium]